MHGTFLFCRKTSVAFSGFRLISFHFVSFHFLMFSSTITLLLDSMLFASLPVNLHVYLRLILMSRPNIFVKHAFRFFKWWKTLYSSILYARFGKKKKVLFHFMLATSKFHSQAQIPIMFFTLQLHRAVAVT